MVGTSNFFLVPKNSISSINNELANIKKLALVKDKLISDLRDTVINNSKLDETQVWVYIIDLPPSQMIEYGEVLPESGKEKLWFSKLSKKLKKKLSKIGN